MIKVSKMLSNVIFQNKKEPKTLDITGVSAHAFRYSITLPFLFQIPYVVKHWITKLNTSYFFLIICNSDKKIKNQIK
ncbi:hypothetical protein ACH33_07950 [Aneurinibacillus sp. XH2]|nr:hypothetical protein ACH33_07950 [Aneurinibacillus sp. XH2]